MLHMGHSGLWTPLETQTPHMASESMTYSDRDHGVRDDQFERQSGVSSPALQQSNQLIIRLEVWDASHGPFRPLGTT